MNLTTTAPKHGVLASFRRTLGIASIAALLTAGLVAPPAQAVATPSSFVFNCDNALADGTTNMTADIGDTFTIRNTGVARACAIGSFSFLAITDLAGSNLPSGGTATTTVDGGGTFTVVHFLLHNHFHVVTTRCIGALNEGFSSFGAFGTKLIQLII